jgi:hypothetical protein
MYGNKQRNFRKKCLSGIKHTKKLDKVNKQIMRNYVCDQKLTQKNA